MEGIISVGDVAVVRGAVSIGEVASVEETGGIKDSASTGSVSSVGVASPEDAVSVAEDIAEEESASAGDAVCATELVMEELPSVRVTDGAGEIDGMEGTSGAEEIAADDGTCSPVEAVGVGDTAAEEAAASEVTETSGRTSVDVTGRSSEELGISGLSAAVVDDSMAGLLVFEKRRVVPKVGNLTEDVVGLGDVESVASVLDTAGVLLAGVIMDCSSTDSVVLDVQSAPVVGADIEVAGLVRDGMSVDGEIAVDVGDRDEVIGLVIVLLKLVVSVSVEMRRELSLEAVLDASDCKSGVRLADVVSDEMKDVEMAVIEAEEEEERLAWSSGGTVGEDEEFIDNVGESVVVGASVVGTDVSSEELDGVADKSEKSEDVDVRMSPNEVDASSAVEVEATVVDSAVDDPTDDASTAEDSAVGDTSDEGKSEEVEASETAEDISAEEVEADDISETAVSGKIDDISDDGDASDEVDEASDEACEISDEGMTASDVADGVADEVFEISDVVGEVSAEADGASVGIDEASD
ncbi:hypothetical protein CKAH01_08885 [Colletotrichum kahawae]|uniref:Uncharacterized protein n=1 Tax=Colletotrichum kahawae TaxID=34407 RepID=A0AAE0CZR9_COLKA|nr:hypothetical protein CKAH01_08885 [Colletotrichum kahawae]